MSPILVRPVREQLEHDRIIRLLQAKSRRRYDVGINPGAEQNTAVGSGPSAVYPDVVLLSQDRGRKVEAVVEVETGESVNHLEALAEWVHFARLRTAFHLYVPSGMVDVARRLCEDNQIVVNEIWSYHAIGEDVRFTLVHRTREAAPAPQRRAVPAPATLPPAPRRKTASTTKRPATTARRTISTTSARGASTTSARSASTGTGRGRGSKTAPRRPAAKKSSGGRTQKRK